QARRLMTNEANAAVKGALKAGAQEVVVNDSHGTMCNIYVSSLSSQAKLISGTPKRLGMMEGINSNFDAAIFIGYHTRSGSQGILNHSYNSRVVRGIKINGEDYGEFGMNALVAGDHGVPVVFVSGCHLLIEEAKNHIKNIHSAEVKRSINRVTSENLHPDVACERIEKGVVHALQNKSLYQSYQLNANNLTFDLMFKDTLMADVAATLPIIEKSDLECVRFNTNNITNGYLIIRSLIMMTNNYA